MTRLPASKPNGLESPLQGSFAEAIFLAFLNHEPRFAWSVSEGAFQPLAGVASFMKLQSVPTGTCMLVFLLLV